MHGKRRGMHSGIQINRWLPWRSVRGFFMIIFHGFLLWQRCSFYVLASYKGIHGSQTAWNTKMPLPSSPTFTQFDPSKSPSWTTSGHGHRDLFPRQVASVVGVNTTEAQQGGHDISRETDRNNHYTEQNVIYTNKCTECHEITEKTIRPKWEDEQRRWGGADRDWAVGTGRDLRLTGANVFGGWARDPKFKEDKEMEMVKLNIVTVTYAHSFYCVSLVTYVLVCKCTLKKIPVEALFQVLKMWGNFINTVEFSFVFAHAQIPYPDYNTKL